MIEKISFQYPWWFLFFCVGAGLFYAYVLYRKETKFDEGPKWLKPLMFALRALAVFTIALLLLGPIIKSLKEDQKNPIVIFAEDRSTSIPSGMNKTSLSDFEKNANTLKDNLSKKYQVETIQFGSEVLTEKTNDYKASSTNISNVLRHIYENYGDQNIGAIVMSSDGIYNEGTNPVYENVKFNAPIHTIALGDTTVRKDLFIKNVLNNKIAYLGDKFSMQVDVAANNCASATTRLKIEKVNENGRKLIQEIPVSIDGKNFFKSFDIAIDADQTGIVKYSVSLSQVQGELSLVNNKKEVYIEVLDGRQNILVLGNAPHPDIAALNALISNNKNYKVKTAFINDVKVNVADYNLVILHNLPSDQNDAASEITLAKNKSIPLIYIAGSQINQVKFNQVQDVVRIKGNTKNIEDTEPALNPAFSPFTLSDGLKTQLSRFPPMTSQFGIFEAVPGSNVLMYQKIKKIPTKYPLFAFADKAGVKTGVIAGEGLWKWRLTDYVENGNFDKIGELVNKSIQLVTVKDDKRKFRVNLPKNLFKENENIVFDAQVYNDAFEMINDGDVLLTIKDQNKKEYKYNFSKTNKYYTLDAGLFPEGSYSYTASTLYKGSPLTATGKFSVEAIQLEQYDLTARHDVMKGLSNKFNGRMYTIANMLEVEKAIVDNKAMKPMVFQSTQTKSLLHYKWIFFLILAFLSIEWFLRRYYGSY